MKALINNPKRTALFCFCTMLITIVFDILNQYTIYKYIDLILIIFRQLYFGRLLLVVYLGIILFKKNKDMRLLNIIALIQLIIFAYNELNMLLEVDFISWNVLFYSWNVLFYFITISIMIYLMINIMLKRKINYKLYSIICGIILLIVVCFSHPLSLTINSIYGVLGSISYLAFIIFIYSYGKSIKERK